jgi:hypothetical protein
MLHAMKNLFFLLCLFASVSAIAQNKKQVIIEKRARELHRMIGLNDKEQWKKFMNENYAKAMLERPVTTKVETSEKESTSSSSTETADKLEEKVKVFQKLHGDFGNSKIKSIKTLGERVEMILENSSGLNGNFNITYESQSPFLINRIAIEIHDR